MLVVAESLDGIREEMKRANDIAEERLAWDKKIYRDHYGK